MCQDHHYDILYRIPTKRYFYFLHPSILGKSSTTTKREIFGQADRKGERGEGGLAETNCENVDPFLSFVKWPNNPKYDNSLNKIHK